MGQQSDPSHPYQRSHIAGVQAQQHPPGTTCRMSTGPLLMGATCVPNAQQHRGGCLFSVQCNWHHQCAEAVTRSVGKSEQDGAFASRRAHLRSSPLEGALRTDLRICPGQDARQAHICYLSCPIPAQQDWKPHGIVTLEHYKIWKNHKSTSRARVELLQNLIALGCCRPGLARTVQYIQAIRAEHQRLWSCQKNTPSRPPAHAPAICRRMARPGPL